MRRDRLRDLWCHHDVPAWQGHVTRTAVSLSRCHAVSHSALTANTDTRHWLISDGATAGWTRQTGLPEPEPESGQGRCSALYITGGWRGQRTGHSQAAQAQACHTQPHQPPASQELNKASSLSYDDSGARQEQGVGAICTLNITRSLRQEGPFWLEMDSTLHYICIVAWPTDWLASATALEAISTRSPLSLSLLCEAPIIIWNWSPHVPGAWVLPLLKSSYQPSRPWSIGFVH